MKFIRVEIKKIEAPRAWNDIVGHRITGYKMIGHPTYYFTQIVSVFVFGIKIYSKSEEIRLAPIPDPAYLNGFSSMKKEDRKRMYLLFFGKQGYEDFCKKLDYGDISRIQQFDKNIPTSIDRSEDNNRAY